MLLNFKNALIKVSFVFQSALMVILVQVVFIHAHLNNTDGFVEVLVTVLQKSAMQSQGAIWVSVFINFLSWKGCAYACRAEVN